MQCFLCLLRLRSNNYASFHLRWKENLVKYQKASKYYDYDCLRNLLLLFVSLLTATIVKNSYIFARIYFIFLKKCPRPNLRLIEKIGKVIMQKKLSTFLQISCSNSRLNCVKNLRVTKTPKPSIKFEGTWGNVVTKICFQRQSWTKYLRQTLVFIWNTTQQDEFNYYFLWVFFWYWQNLGLSKCYSFSFKLTFSLQFFCVFFLLDSFYNFCFICFWFPKDVAKS